MKKGSQRAAQIQLCPTAITTPFTECTRQVFIYTRYRIQILVLGSIVPICTGGNQSSVRLNDTPKVMSVVARAGFGL